MEDPIRIVTSRHQDPFTFLPNIASGYFGAHTTRANAPFKGFWLKPHGSHFESNDGNLFNFTNTKSEAITISSRSSDWESSSDERPENLAQCPSDLTFNKNAQKLQNSQNSGTASSRSSQNAAAKGLQNSHRASPLKNVTTTIKCFNLNGIERRVSYSLPLQSKKEPASTIDLTQKDQLDDDDFGIFDEDESRGSFGRKSHSSTSYITAPTTPARDSSSFENHNRPSSPSYDARTAHQCKQPKNWALDIFESEKLWPREDTLQRTVFNGSKVKPISLSSTPDTRLLDSIEEVSPHKSDGKGSNRKPISLSSSPDTRILNTAGANPSHMRNETSLKSKIISLSSSPEDQSVKFIRAYPLQRANENGSKGKPISVSSSPDDRLKTAGQKRLAADVDVLGYPTQHKKLRTEDGRKNYGVEVDILLESKSDSERLPDPKTLVPSQQHRVKPLKTYFIDDSETETESNCHGKSKQNKYAATSVNVENYRPVNIQTVRAAQASATTLKTLSLFNATPSENVGCLRDGREDIETALVEPNGGTEGTNPLSTQDIGERVNNLPNEMTPRRSNLGSTEHSDIEILASNVSSKPKQQSSNFPLFVESDESSEPENSLVRILSEKVELNKVFEPNPVTKRPTSSIFEEIDQIIGPSMDSINWPLNLNPMANGQEVPARQECSSNHNANAGKMTALGTQTGEKNPTTTVAANAALVDKTKVNDTPPDSSQVPKQSSISTNMHMSCLEAGPTKTRVIDDQAKKNHMKNFISNSFIDRVLGKNKEVRCIEKNFEEQGQNVYQGAPSNSSRGKEHSSAKAFKTPAALERTFLGNEVTSGNARIPNNTRVDGKRIDEVGPLTAAAAIRKRKELWAEKIKQALPKEKRLLLELRDRGYTYKEISSKIAEAGDGRLWSHKKLREDYKKIKLSLDLHPGPTIGASTVVIPSTLAASVSSPADAPLRNLNGDRPSKSKHEAEAAATSVQRRPTQSYSHQIPERPYIGGKTINQAALEAHLATLSDDDSDAASTCSSVSTFRSPSPFTAADAVYWAYQIRRKTWASDEDESQIEWTVVGPSAEYHTLAEANRAASAELAIARDDFSICADAREVVVSHTTDGLAIILAKSPIGFTRIEVARFVRNASMRSDSDRDSDSDHGRPFHSRASLSKCDWAPRRVYDIRRTTTATVYGPDPTDQLFDEVVTSCNTVTEDVDDAVYTVADMANLAASRALLDVACPKDSMRMEVVIERGKEQERLKILCEKLEAEFDSATAKGEIADDGKTGLFDETWTARSREVKRKGADGEVFKEREERSVRVFVTRRWLKGPRNI